MHSDGGGRTAAELAALMQTLQAKVPLGLQERPQWLLWRFERYEGDAKPRKVPYYVSGRKRRGQQGSEEDRAELAAFAAALAQLRNRPFEGLGFAFLPGDGLVGVDVDDAIDEDGVVSPLCQQVMQVCGSYAELSPSGRGVHVLGLAGGEVQSFRDNALGLEVYAGRQFFTVTGRHWADTPEQLQVIPDAAMERLRGFRDEAAAARQAAARGRGGAATPAAASQPGVNDFSRVNAAALVLLDAWVPALFPQARKQGTGAWRVSSKSLGRDLQEDLSLHPSGISDFGAEIGLTPIDVVVRFGARKPAEALHWLAGQIGMQLTAARPARASAARSARAEEGASTPSAGSAVEAGQGGGGQGGGDDPPAGADGKPAPRKKPQRPSWADGLKTDRNGWADCRENVFMLMTQHPELKGLVGWDEFAHRVMKRRQPPWDSPPGEWLPQDDYSLGLWLLQATGMTVKAESTLVAGVGMAAWAARYHPVKAYLDGLPAWDEIERLPFWLSDCLGAEDSTYTRLIGTWFLMGAVQRIRQPGCQMDYMLVLEGLQGRRKSTALATLMPDREWFSDTPMRLGDKDSMLSLAGKWLVEMGELASLSRSEAEEIKQYLSSRVDRVREPFARRFVDRQRSCVFGGTTNQGEYFKDPTGARRFWPVHCHGVPDCDGGVDLAKLASWRDQLFAEAMARLASSDPEVARYYPTRQESEQYLQPEQERREITDPWYERLATWLDSNVKFDGGLDEVCDIESFTTDELLTRCIGVPRDRIDGARQMSTRIGIAMHKLGWHKRRDSSPPRLWRYWRPERTDPTPARAGGSVDETTAGGPAWGEGA